MPELKTNTLRDQMNEALDRIELFTPSEKRIHQKKMEKLKAELGLKKFQEYLLERAGLL